MSNGNSSELLGPGGEQQEEGTLMPKTFPECKFSPKNYMDLLCQSYPAWALLLLFIFVY